MTTKTKAHIALLATNIFFALNFTTVKYLINGGFLKPFGLNLIRVGVTAALLWVLYIFSKEKSLISQLSLSWGVRAFYYAEEESLDDIIFDQINILKERGFVKTGDIVINTGSTPVHLHLPTNMIKVTKVE